LSKSLAEEEIADNLLTQVARELMSESRTGATKEPKHATALESVDDYYGLRSLYALVSFLKMKEETMRHIFSTLAVVFVLEFGFSSIVAA
jgi:hypothetical protein